MDQGGLKIDHDNRRAHYTERQAEDQEGNGMDLDRRKDRHKLGQNKAEMYMEHGKVALREVQTELTLATKHLLVHRLSLLSRKYELISRIKGIWN